MPARGQYRFGYRATLTEGGTRAYVLVQRDLGPTEIARLTRIFAGFPPVLERQRPRSSTSRCR